MPSLCGIRTRPSWRVRFTLDKISRRGNISFRRLCLIKRPCSDRVFFTSKIHLSPSLSLKRFFNGFCSYLLPLIEYVKGTSCSSLLKYRVWLTGLGKLFRLISSKRLSLNL